MNKLVLFIFVLTGCFSNHYKPSKSTNIGLDDSQFPSSLFLENRVENCDSAIAFMRKIVVPMGLRYGNGNVGIKYRIPGETILHNRKPSFSYRFYISPSCFVGHPLEDVLGVFCTPEDKKKLLLHDKQIRKLGDKTWYILFLDGFGYSTEGVVVDSNRIISSHVTIEKD